MRILLAFYLLLVGASGAATEDHWPRFRGANADGVAPDHKGLPTNWATTENVKWVADVPGWGWSCPIVWGDRVFLTTVVGDEENTRGKREREKGSGEGKGVRLNYRQAPPGGVAQQIAVFGCHCWLAQQCPSRLEPSSRRHYKPD